jgi:HEAT repeat protein
VRALHRLRAPEAVPALARAALDDLDDGVRETAVHALGKAWTESAVEPLIRALGDARAAVRAAAADALRSAAMDDPSARVRERALVALSRVGAADAVESLTIATRDGSPRVQGIARDILGAIDPTGTP